MKKLAVLIFLCLSIIASALEGKVVSVADGDTITVQEGNRKYRIRFYGVDAPETKQEYGEDAKRYLNSMVYGKIVNVEEKDKDEYGRIVGKVFLDGKDVNLQMVEAGYAWHYKHFAPNEVKYAMAEKSARKDKRGLWAGKNPVAPWNFRRYKK